MRNHEAEPAVEYEKPEKSREILDAEKLDKCLERAALELRNREIPVDKSGKIDMDEFAKRKVYSDLQVKQDKDFVAKMEKKWKLEGIESEGEEFEKLVTVIFHKYLPKGFSIVRSSRYDDATNAVDNFLIEEKTGSIICSLDEIESDNAQRVKDKIDKINRLNMRGGATIKYGLSYEKRSGKVRLGEERNVPIFLLAVTSSSFEKEIRYLRGSLEEKSDQEKAFFAYLTSLVGVQISKMRKSNLNVSLGERMEKLEYLLRQISKEIGQG